MGHASTGDAETVRDQLRHVYCLGGGSGSGKSTIARRVASEHGFHVYGTDDVMADHGRRTTPGDSPALAEFMAMDMDERWLDRSPAVMLDTFHWFRGEGFGLIVEDLLGLPPQTPVVAEGFRLLPQLVAPLLADRSRALWLLPTPELRRVAFEHRGSLWAIAGRTSDPELALRNLLERDRMFTERLREETARLGLRSIDVDVSTPEEVVAQRVADAFQI